jgi:hypothetical protein
MVLLAKSKRQLPLLLIGWLVSFILVPLVLTWLYIQQGMTLSLALVFTLTSKLADVTPLSPWPLGLARALHNWVILLFRSFTPVLTLLGIMGLWQLTHKARLTALALLIWFLSSALAAQWWDGLLAGRHLLLALFPLSLGAAFQITNNLRRFGLTGYLLIVSLGAVWLLNQSVPVQQTQQALEKLPPNGLVIASHFARPWLNYPGTIRFVNEPGTDQNFSYAIDRALAHNRPVFITSQALADPYGVYTGPYLHPLSLGFRKPSKLNDLVQDYRFVPVATPSAQDHLTIYQVTAEPKLSEFRPDSVPAWHRRRLDFFDPVSWLWFTTVKLIKLDTIPA